MTTPDPRYTALQNLSTVLDDALALIGEGQAVTAQVAGLTSERDSLAAQVTDLTTDKATLTSAVLARDTQIATLTGKVSDLTAQVAALKAAQVNPASPVKFHVGSSRPTALDDVLTIKRSYETNPTVISPRPTGGPLLAMTYKATPTAASLDARLRASRPGDRIGFFHEPEDDVEKFLATGSGLNPVTYRTQTILLCDAIVALGPATAARPISVLMEWSIDGAAAPRKNLVKNELWTPEVLAALKRANGILGIDVYSKGVAANGGPDRSYSSMFDTVAQLAADNGLDWGVYETGAKIKPTATKAVADAHADWWKGYFDYLGAMSKPPVDVLIWNREPLAGDMDGTTYAIDAFPQIVQVWRDASAKFDRA